jgi:hypothetical protein
MADQPAAVHGLLLASRFVHRVHLTSRELTAQWWHRSSRALQAASCCLNANVLITSIPTA